MCDALQLRTTQQLTLQRKNVKFSSEIMLAGLLDTEIINIPLKRRNMEDS